MGGLIDPRLVQGLGFLFNKKLTIQVPTLTQDSTGQPLDEWTDLAGLVDIPAVIGPASASDRRGTEERKERQAVTTNAYKALLQGFFPAIATGMRAVSGGKAYDIIGATSDSQDLITTLVLEVVTL